MFEGAPLFTDDAVVLGILLSVIALVFITAQSSNKICQTTYKYVPPLVIIYLIPSLLNTFNIVSVEYSNLYYIASQYLLPVCLVLLTLSIDLKSIVHLGPKLFIMFLIGTITIILGGPLAIMIVSVFSPETVGGAGPDAVWRGLSTLAGSWIGGGANQTAMKVVFDVSDSLFVTMVSIDILFGGLWVSILLYLAGRANYFDQKWRANTAAYEAVRLKMPTLQLGSHYVPKIADTMSVLAIGFAVAALGHLVANFIVPLIDNYAPNLSAFSLNSKFLWVVLITTTGGVLLSFTRARELENVGASRLGTVFLYILIATIGMHMDILDLFKYPGLFVVGAIWLGFHALCMILATRWMRTPVFYMAVGSAANIGGVATAPVIAAAFHPSLAPVGVLLAFFGYALGTYGAYISAQLMRIVVSN